MSTPPTHHGGCQCGAVRYTISGRMWAYCCHCTECRKQAASAFGMSIPTKEEDFTIEGELGVWTRPTDTGSYTDCYFCKTCGSRVYHSGRSRPGMITVKAGSLDDPDAVKMTGHIWVRSKPEWLVLSDGLPQVEEQPRSIEEWTEFLEAK